MRASSSERLATIFRTLQDKFCAPNCAVPWDPLRKAPYSSERRPRRHRVSVLSGERLDDCLGDRVDILLEDEMAAVEIAHLGGRHIPLHYFRSIWQKDRVISTPDNERPRLPVLQIGV